MTKYLILLIFFLILITNKPKVLFVGDSLTSYRYGWQDQLSKSKNFKSVNISQGGKRTSWMLERLKENLDSNHYDRIYIYGGVNDIFSEKSEEVIVDNIQKMVDLSLSHKIDPIIILGYEPHSLMSGKEKYIDRYADLQKKIKSEVIGVLWTNLIPQMVCI